MSPRHVLVTGASPDNENRNTILRNYVAEGFRDVLGADAVTHVPLEIALAAAKRHAPDLIVCFGSCMPDDADYLALRQHCDTTGATLAFWLHDDPYEIDFSYRIDGIADVVFSNDRWSAEHYNHPHAYHLPLAASRAAHWRPISQSKDIGIFFCGVAFDNRIRLVRDLKQVLQRFDTRILGDQWPEHELPFARNRRLSNDELSRNYARALITLNMGRDFHYANERYRLDPSTPGPRTFEAAMAGTTQLYFVESLEIEDYYAPEKEIVLYNSVAEFERKVQALMADPAHCTDIAAAAQSRTLADHTYTNRARTIIDTVAAIGQGRTQETA
ncbi:CgeB family protein [Lysobacter tyrosinilyticus]